MNEVAASKTHDRDEPNEKKQEDNTDEIEQASQKCFQLLLQNTALQHLIDDRNKQRRKFIAYADILDVLEREGANKGNPHVLSKVITHDFQLIGSYVLTKNNHTYVITRDDLSQSSYVPKSAQELTDAYQMIVKGRKRILDTNQMTEIRLKDLRDFVQETDLFTYMLDFFRDHSTPNMHGVLVLACDPVMSESMLMHYLHTQYLVEKAYTSQLKANKENKTVEVLKTLVMLIYTNRVQTQSKESLAQPSYPLIFSSMWKHVFVDALLPADYLNEVQINDINLFDKNTLTQICERIEPNNSKLLENSFELALNSISISTRNQDGFYHDVQILKQYLLSEPIDGGDFQRTLRGRLQDVLSDPENGATACLKAVLKQPLRERGSLRSEFMGNLAQKIKSMLAEILALVFENRTSSLYRSTKEPNAKIDELFLQLLSEPKIVRVSQRTQANQDRQIVLRDDIPDGACFPFSARIHAHLSSFRDTCFEIYERTKQNINERLLEFLILQIHAFIQTTPLKIDLNHLSRDMMQRLLHDIVHLEANATFGLNRFPQQIHNILINHICEFMDHASMDALKIFSGSKTKKDVAIVKKEIEEEEEEKKEVVEEDEKTKEPEPEKNQKKKRKKTTHDSDDESVSEEENMWDKLEDLEAINKENEEMKEVEPFHKQESDDFVVVEQEQEEKKTEAVVVEEIRFQVTEVYAILWSHDDLLCSFVDVLSVVHDHSKRDLENMDNVWKEQLSLHEYVAKMLAIVLEVVEKSLEITLIENMKHKLDHLSSISQAFERVVQWLNQGCPNKDLTKDLSQRWDLLKLSMLCITATKYQTRNGALTRSIKERFANCQFDNIDSLNALLVLVQNSLNQDRVNEHEINEILQWLVQNYVGVFGLKTAASHRHEIGYTISNDFAEKLIQWIGGRPNTLLFAPTSFTKMEIGSQLISIIRKKEHQNVRNLLMQHLQACDLNNEFAVLLIRAQEHFLHFREMVHRKRLEQEDKPDVQKFVRLSETLKEKVNNRSLLDILLTIAECKMWTYYLSHYISRTMAISYAYGKEGIRHFWLEGKEKRIQLYLSGQECSSIGQLYRCDQSKTAEMERQIRQGLKYYLMVELWRRKGSTAALHLNGRKFKSLFGFSVGISDKQQQSDRIKNIPSNDIFQLLEYSNNQKLDNAFKEMHTVFANAFTSNQIDWQTFDRKRFIHFIAGIFTELYLKNDTSHFDTITKFTRSISRYFNDHLQGAQSTRCHDRVRFLFSQFCVYVFSLK
ncbi:hypothetical protein RFI_22838 [Reticulomyxa filosa]|uniref:Uncharacterized protein n=1 Tax=Reticulomyxa filosa TaxID=46433 RepID=X6MN58_RETFI|nr:hypothetical protein RFI_22838 [Reticulomyxa filosa]|eukprot:ETO14530.1 hypothetical protein RFI_22838 [Reticulomyxa filosa]